MGLRERFAFPPYTHLAVLTARSAQEELARLALDTLYKRLLAAMPPIVEISEPMPAPIAKAYGQFRYQCTLKCANVRPLSDITAREIARLSPGDDVVITLDVDAYNFM